MNRMRGTYGASVDKISQIKMKYGYSGGDTSRARDCDIKENLLLEQGKATYRDTPFCSTERGKSRADGQREKETHCREREKENHFVDRQNEIHLRQRENHLADRSTYKYSPHQSRSNSNAVNNFNHSYK